jgi:hypothetical protein
MTALLVLVSPNMVELTRKLTPHIIDPATLGAGWAAHIGLSPKTQS